jgi:hypothetical protein
MCRSSLLGIFGAGVVKQGTSRAKGLLSACVPIRTAGAAAGSPHRHVWQPVGRAPVRSLAVSPQVEEAISEERTL